MQSKTSFNTQKSGGGRLQNSRAAPLQSATKEINGNGKWRAREFEASTSSWTKGRASQQGDHTSDESTALWIELMTVTRESKDSAFAPEAGTPRQRKPKDRGAKFNDKHALKYGLSICSRNAKDNSVEMVMCKFCVAFGKESAADSNRKRRATANIKYFRQPFRADHYLSHLEINHKHRWAEYERATGPEKEVFFSMQIEEVALGPPLPPAAVTSPEESADGAVTPVKGHVPVPPVEEPRVGPVRLPVSEIEKEVVEFVVGEMFFNATEEEGVTKAQALEVFVQKEGSENFEISIKNQRLYDLAIKFVSCGASYRLASRLIQCTKEETQLTHYGGCTDLKVAGYVRAILASNLQRIAWMMRSAWAYALATEVANHQQTSYLDVRVRLWHNSGLRDFHLMAIPAFEQQPAPAVIARLEKLMNVLDPRWRAKLIGTTANGGMDTGRNVGVTGSQQGLAARLTGLVTKPSFYLIWSGVHQLELVAKNCITSFCDKSFFDDLINVLSAVRQDQQGVFDVRELPDLPSAYAISRGFVATLIKALKWLVANRLAVTQYMKTVRGSTPLSPSWWVCVAVSHRLMAEVDYFMKKLVNMEPSSTLVSDQVQDLCRLALIMADVVGARRDLWEAGDAADACTAGSFLLTFQNAQQFIQNEGGPLAIEMFDTLRGVERTQISKSVAEFAVGVVAAVASIAQDGRHYCAESAGVVVNPPIVMPYDVHTMGKAAFNRMLVAQDGRLRATFTSDEIRRIQSDYYYFQVAIETKAILSGVLKKHSRETDVSFAWSCVNGRFLLLQEFIGGLSTVVPEASIGTLSADLMYLNWEKPDYRQSMVDFALEGILHARQKMKIEVVDVNYMRAALRPGSGEGANLPAELATPIDTATPAGGPTPSLVPEAAAEQEDNAGTTESGTATSSSSTDGEPRSASVDGDVVMSESIDAASTESKVEV